MPTSFLAGIKKPSQDRHEGDGLLEFPGWANWVFIAGNSHHSVVS